MDDSSLYEKQLVTTWLERVDYSDDPNYVPSEFALKFINFIKLVNGGEGEENTSPVLHLKMLDQVASGASRIANMVFRGAAKTTVMGEYLILYLAVYGELPNFGMINLAIYVSDSVDNGVKNMRKNLQYRYENSEFLQKYIPTANFTDIRWEFINVAGGRFIVKGYGAKTGVRGTKELGTRPQLAILDDLVSDEDARSATVISSIEDTVYKAIDFALHPKRNKIIWSGTPFNAGDPLYKAVESGAWKVNAYPVCEKFPCTEEEFKGAWSDRFDYKYVSLKYQQSLQSGKVSDFNQELMLRIMSEDDRLILDNDIRWYSRANLLKNKGSFNFYATTDFAVSEKDSADFSVIVIWAVNYIGQWFWVDSIVKRQTMDKNLDDLFRFAMIYPLMSVGIEVSGQQAGFIPFIEREMMNKNIYFPLASSNNSNIPGIRPTSDKFKRFQTVVPYFKQGKILLPQELKHTPEIVEAVLELSQTAISGFKSNHDDVLDNVSMLPLLQAWYPSQPIELKESANGLWEIDEGNQDSYNSYYV